jgi:hypothetical protein
MIVDVDVIVAGAGPTGLLLAGDPSTPPATQTRLPCTRHGPAVSADKCTMRT